eukprot:7380814-Prymnesium_polylepis.3
MLFGPIGVSARASRLHRTWSGLASALAMSSLTVGSLVNSMWSPCCTLRHAAPAQQRLAALRARADFRRIDALPFSAARWSIGSAVRMTTITKTTSSSGDVAPWLPRRNCGLVKFIEVESGYGGDQLGGRDLRCISCSSASFLCDRSIIHTRETALAGGEHRG